MKNILRLTFLVLFVQQLSAQTLDAGFSTGTGFNSLIYSIAQQPGGKILVGGSFTTFNGSAANYITMLENNGTLDATFTSTSNGTVTSIYRLSDQRIMIGGAFSLFNGQSRNRLVCLRSDYTIDSSFHYGTGFSGGTANIQGITQQADGKILVVGEFTQYDLTGAGHIIRLNLDGTVDSSFNSTLGANSIGIYQAICQPDGKILVSGSFTSYNGIPLGNVARLNTDGSLDSTFHTYGSGIGANLLVRAIALQNDGNVICGGAFTSFNGLAKNRLIRLDANGGIDTTFNIGTGPASSVNVMAIHPAGKILIGGGFATYNNIASKRFAVLNTDGSLDASFAIGTGFTGTGSVAAIHCTPDGKVLVGGFFAGFNGTTAGCIVRLNNTNPLPVTYTKFTATKRVEDVELNWTTASELNNRGFAIERSNGNGRWEEIGFVAGNGNSSFARQYRFTDREMVSTVVYYRLKQIDYNGEYNYSNIVIVSRSAMQSISVGPNPFTDKIELGTAADIILYDANGIAIIKAESASSINTSHLATGFYTLKISTGNQTVFQKLVK
jgi:uncharacterized delta-60 repeat protein